MVAMRTKGAALWGGLLLGVGGGRYLRLFVAMRTKYAALWAGCFWVLIVVGYVGLLGLAPTTGGLLRAARSRNPWNIRIPHASFEAAPSSYSGGSQGLARTSKLGAPDFETLVVLYHKSISIIQIQFFSL